MMILQWRLPMVMWSFFLIYGMCFIFVFSTKTEFRIAWMAPKKEYYNLSAYSSVGALKIALSAIRRNPTNRIQSLHNSTIKVRWYDTDCNAKSALAAAVDAKSKFDPHLFLGPPCSVGMKGVALLASQWKTPVFGWVSQEEEFQDKKMYSTLVRFLGPLNRFPNVMFHLQSLFKWSQFSVVYDKRDPYRAVAEALYEKKSNENMDSSMNWYNIVNSFKVSNDMSDKQIEEIFRQIKKYSRIVVMALPWLDMRKYMLVAHKLGMSDGDYAFLCIHGDLYTYDRMETDVFSDLVWRKNDSYDSIAKDAFEPVFHVMMKPLEKTHWNLFKKIASDFTSSTDPNWNLPEPPEEYIPPDAYAPYLYDATLVWAILADKILKENKNPHDGEYMFLKATTLTDEVEVDGLTGKVNLDNHGDRNLNFQVLDMTENGTFESILTIKYQNKMMQVEFVNNKTEENLSRWPNGKVGIKYAPPDEPIYGFDGKKCPEQDEQPDRTFIYVFSAGGVVFVVVVATILYCILKMAYDDVYRVIGAFGRYQKFIYVLQTLPVIFAAVQTYLSVFILYVPDHRFVVSLVFFGLSWNVSNLGDDVFLNFFLTSIAQIADFLLCIPLLNRVGRKPVYVTSIFTGGIALLLTIFPVKYGSSDIEWMTISLSLIGMTGSSMAVATLFLYSAELFPTVVRNSGLGIANLCARIGGIIAPYIPDLNKTVSGDIGRILPMSIFGTFAILAGLLSLLLPETNKLRLPETLGDAVLQNEGHTHRDMGMVTVTQPLNETPQNNLTITDFKRARGYVNIHKEQFYFIF